MLAVGLCLQKQLQNIGQSIKTQRYRKQLKKLKAEAEKYGQGHLFANVDQLNEEKDFKEFIAQVKQIDYKLMKQIYESVYLKNLNEKVPNEAQDIYETIDQKLSLDLQTSEEKQRLENLGLQAIAKGEVCIVIMAGGQGSRLGFDHPKGMFDLKLQSKKNLFQIFVDRLNTLQRLAKEKYPQLKKGHGQNLIHMLIMTSEATDAETREYFAKNQYLGFEKSCVHFFVQSSFPSVDLQGKIILQDKNSIFLAPNGNGGLYLAIAPYLDFFQKNSIKYIQIMGVDNCLMKPCDPIMIGFSIDKNLQIVSKYIAKNDPHESVGVHLRQNKKIVIKEYSDMTESMKLEKNPDNTIKYSQAFICTLIMRIDLLEYIIKNFEKCSLFHKAVKKIEYFDVQKQTKIKPSTPNGVKFEMFIFDPYTLCNDSQFGLFEASREEEFAPLKNNVKDSKDQTEETARDLFSKLHQKWLQNAGFKFQQKAGSKPNELCEVDFKITYNGENLQKYVPKYGTQQEFTPLPLYIK